jgi:hypothetical protein
MASKLGFILSLFFVVQMMAYAGDLSSIQAIHSLVDAVSISAGKEIAIQGSITPKIVTMVKNDCGGEIYAISEAAPQVGEVYEFAIQRAFSPLIISSSPMAVTVKRSVVIGYLD